MEMGKQHREYARYYKRNMSNGGINMAMRPDEIVAVLRRQIEEFESTIEVEDPPVLSLWLVTELPESTV